MKDVHAVDAVRTRAGHYQEITCPTTAPCSTTTSLAYDIAGPADGPLLVLGPSLGTSRLIWDAHSDFLNEQFRVLRYDLPGHGGSPTAALGHPVPGTTTVARLADSVLELVDQVGGDTFAYAGISLGGAVGTQLALAYPNRITALGLICTSAHFGGRTAWRERAALVRRSGMAPLAESSPSRWFAEPATADSPLGRSLLDSLTRVEPDGYAACCDMLATFDLRTDLHTVTAPTWVLGGTRDVATPVVHARELADSIPRAGLRIADCAHLALEAPEAVGALLRHLRTAAAGPPPDCGE
ncbi:alpha/beta fold hydrolase [Streptomyces sp. NBC_00466]|uniref:alpha/beta fold hydrolase n=1 Tax=Streptomyces sp. NBC_00466 TaxID=2903655 RepID=UPI0030DE0E62